MNEYYFNLKSELLFSFRGDNMAVKFAEISYLFISRQ